MKNFNNISSKEENESAPLTGWEDVADYAPTTKESYAQFVTYNDNVGEFTKRNVELINDGMNKGETTADRLRKYRGGGVAYEASASIREKEDSAAKLKQQIESTQAANEEILADIEVKKKAVAVANRGFFRRAFDNIRFGFDSYKIADNYGIPQEEYETALLRRGSLTKGDSGKLRKMTREEQIKEATEGLEKRHRNNEYSVDSMRRGLNSLGSSVDREKYGNFNKKYNDYLRRDRSEDYKAIQKSIARHQRKNK